MFSRLRSSKSTNELRQTEMRPLPRNGRQTGDEKNRPIVITTTGTGGQRKYYIYSMAFLAGGKHIVIGGEQGTIRRWQVADGKEVGPSMDAESQVLGLAVSQDSQLIVSGTASGRVIAWSATSCEKVREFRGHSHWVSAVDMSSDGTSIVTGSDDRTALVWSLEAGRRLMPLPQEDCKVSGVRFSPDGQLIATATLNESVHIYDSHNGRLLVRFPIKVEWPYNNTLAWASDSKRLFVLSRDGKIHCLDVSARKLLVRWPIHSDQDPRCIALAPNDAFIAASANHSVSFWNTTTYEQIGSLIRHSCPIRLICISTRHIAIAGDLEVTLQNLRGIVPSDYLKKQTLHEWELLRLSPRNTNIRETVQLPVLNASSNEVVVGLEKKIAELHGQLEISRRLSAERENQLAASRQREDSLTRIVQSYEKKHHCEMLYKAGRFYDAAKFLLDMVDNMCDELRDYKPIIDWLHEFADRCVTKLSMIGNNASMEKKHDEALAAYSTALSLTSSPPKSLLNSWARMAIIRCSIDEELRSAKFKFPQFRVYLEICEVFEANGRILEAVDYFQRLQSESPEELDILDERVQWESDFRQRSIKKLQKFGDAARKSKRHDSAIKYYSAALSLHPIHIDRIIVPYCKARAGWLQNELNNATKDIEHNSSCYKGYQRKYVALRRMCCHKEAFKAFKMMLLRMEESPDPGIRKLRDQFIDTTSSIQRAIDQTIREIPHVLIDVDSGRLCDKELQTTSFKAHPIYEELRSLMTTHGRLDHARISREVEAFYKYVMFSHKWQPGEPKFRLLKNSSVGELPASPANNKLRGFCEIVRSRGFRWCWSDTCCVNQVDKSVQQESVVAMFRWYRRSALTVIHLLGVFSKSQEVGCLLKSVWNTRGWTFQEYVASEVVQFYTEDWKPYLGLDMYNHKDSPTVRSEMEKATRLDTEELEMLQPGLERVREKLFLASSRETTREEDIAYSLFGIFDVAIPIIYGEGKQVALRRLLEHILSRSDNVTLLSWTGTSASGCSYLPTDLTVYNQVAAPHVPQPIEEAGMDSEVTALRLDLSNLSSTVQLYERLFDHSRLSFVTGRLRLSGLVFPITNFVSLDSIGGSHLVVYRATTSILGDIRIESKDDLSEMQGLLLVHPWISPLLDLDFAGATPRFDLDTRALRLLVRLKQPFGALLLALSGRAQYRRVATDGFIRVKIQRKATVRELVDSIRVVDVQ